MIGSSFRVGAVRERADGEHRVSITPLSVVRLVRTGAEVLVESGAGTAAWMSDADYVAAGARICTLADVLDSSTVITCVQSPAHEVLGRMHAGQILVGLLGTRTDIDIITEIRSASVVGLDLSLLPRTLSSAQSMDAMTSQDSVAGYKAAVLAADTFGQYFPMMITAAGTSRPARVLVLGAGIAGLQAMATARRLGAEVTGYDVRPECRAEIVSLGATFLDLAESVTSVGDDGYARELTADEREAQQRQVQAAVPNFDVLITTARVPGRRPPNLVTTQAIDGMRPGSVIIDMAASALGGNVDGSRAEDVVVTDRGVTVVGAGQLASAIPGAASSAYARNVADVIAHIVRDGAVRIDIGDPIDAALAVGAAKIEDRKSDYLYTKVSP